MEQDHVGNNRYLIAWNSLGELECLLEINAMAHQDTIERLTGQRHGPSHVNRTISMMIMRARFNEQRNIEVYLIETDSSITTEDMESNFQTNPQGLVDLVRERGTHLYGEPARPKNIRIV